MFAATCTFGRRIVRSPAALLVPQRLQPRLYRQLPPHASSLFASSTILPSQTVRALSVCGRWSQLIDFPVALGSWLLRKAGTATTKGGGEGLGHFSEFPALKKQCVRVTKTHLLLKCSNVAATLLLDPLFSGLGDLCSLMKRGQRPFQSTQLLFLPL